MTSKLDPAALPATPGPWFAVNEGTDDEPMMSVKAARIAGREPRHCVAIVATGDSPQSMENANANLIAAAPDLYEALEAVLPILEWLNEAGSEEKRAAYAKARAALAKARGQQS